MPVRKGTLIVLSDISATRVALYSNIVMY